MANDGSASAAASHGQGQGSHETTSSRCVTETFTATHNFEVTDFSLLHGMGICEFVSSTARAPSPSAATTGEHQALPRWGPEGARSCLCLGVLVL
ncbi:Speckle-type POZ protein [Panicum miliaceum]|uniref:Speckle-type POZ protein n=1 Tax=Panicum miliaceum TaxID=4540 RepID=A0A3L6Q854_PANMI|nr:Speckle-type POZ protein [Panicum miliaceum]